MFQMLNMFTKKINESKIFAGVIIIILNVGGKLVPITLSKSAENILKSKISRDIIIFAIAWMGTRDIIISIILTLTFILISDLLLNYDSKYCCIPPKKRHMIIEDPDITDEEINKAILVLEKSKKNKEKESQHNAYVKFFNT